MASTYPTHDHHDHQGAALSEAASAVLEAAGERWTDMRAQIFDVLSTLDRAASAYEITELVSKLRNRRVAPNSVYRILDLFVATNLAKRVETANAYIVNSHPGCEHDCIFLICDECNGVTHIDEDQIAGQMRDAAHLVGFYAARPVLEMRGRCNACRGG